MRIDGECDAFHHHHGFLQQQQVRLHRHVETAGDGEQAFQQIGDGDVLCLAAADRLAHGAQGGGKSGGVVVRRHIAGLEMNLGDAGIIAGDKAVEYFGEIEPGAAVDAAHDAEIDDADAGMVHTVPRRDHEQIALVQIGVEEALGNGLGEEAVDQHACQGRPVDIERGQRGPVRHLHAVDPVDHQHAPGGALPIDAGHDVIGLAGQDLAQFRRIGGFAAQIELGFDPALEGSDHGARAQAGEFAAQCFNMAGAPFIGGESGGHFGLDAGAQQLDGNGAAIAGDALVDLGDGSGTDGFGFDRLELGFPVAAIDGVQDRLDRAERGRGDGVLQTCQIGGGFEANEIGPGGERLAQFDGGGANRSEAGSEIRGGGGAGAETRDFRQQPYSKRQPPVLKRTQTTTARQPPAPFQQPPQVDDGDQIRPSIPNGWRPRRPGSACI